MVSTQTCTRLLASTLLLGAAAACDGSTSKAEAAEGSTLPPDAEWASKAAHDHPTFSGYWQRGKAELTRFELKQSRYGETHEGEAVWIFVTEPFDTKAQVKHEAGGSPAHVTQVLKLNAYRRFYTGVYPYTLMTSTFLPLDAQQPLKLTFSAQEWCGQVYSQLNRRGDHYLLQSFSYFQAEGDSEEELNAQWTEDGLWALLRRDPEKLPQGELRMLPALHHLRLRHEPQRAQSVTASLEEAKEGVRRYTLRYAGGRTFSIRFEAGFPHGIVGFTEDPGGGLPITRATRTRALVLPYWEKNGADDGAYREALGLEL